MIHAPFAREVLKPPHSNSPIECDVPNSACLFHAIDTFKELHDPVFLARDFESGGLFHVGHFILWQDSMQEGSLYIELV